LSEPFTGVSRLVVVRQLSHHANGFCARLPHHSPSTVWDALLSGEIQAVDSTL